MKFRRLAGTVREDMEAKPPQPSTDPHMPMMGAPAPTAGQSPAPWSGQPPAQMSGYRPASMSGQAPAQHAGPLSQNRNTNVLPIPVALQPDRTPARPAGSQALGDP